MKLIRKTNLNFALIILIVLPIASILLFISLNYFLSDEVDEKLRVDERRIIEQLKNNPEFISMAPIIEVEKLKYKIEIEEEIKNVLVYDPIEKEEEPFRQLASVKEINGKWYLIKVRQSIIEDKDFAIAIGITMIAILLLVFTLLLLLNYRFSKKLWNPFYKNIDQLKLFSFSGEEEIKLEHSTIKEFQDLKDSLEKLTDKLQKDYKSLQEFTENASHEIQTPLSIISLNLEEVLQDNHSEDNYKKLYSCYQSIQRLSKLNDRLLFLTKLDNNQFSALEDIDFNKLFKEKLKDFQSLLTEKGISVKSIELNNFSHKCDPILANMLVLNLISNVVKHALSNSELILEIDSDYFTLINSAHSKINPEELFERFKKGRDSQNSTGLGLSIVKKITEVSLLSIDAKLAKNKFQIRIYKP
jgi:two-component system OmpR family sensor kinase